MQQSFVLAKVNFNFSKASLSKVTEFDEIKTKLAKIG
jgi:hypothetical protein